MNIQWFPGHMSKTKRLLSENLKMVDVVIELLDARIPVSSKNPEIDNIVNNKPKIIVLNKSDLADEKVSDIWKKWYSSKGYTSIFVNSINGSGIKQLKSKMRDIMKDRIKKDRERGRIFRPVKAMIVGVPNVGKSSLINKIAGKGRTSTGDRPGVTRGKQWINVNNEIQLLDTPGILWPKFEDERVGINLAITGAIKDNILDITELASALFEILSKDYPEYLTKRYKLGEIEDKSGLDILKEAGKKRGCIISGGEIDMMRISAIVLDEFRGAKIGKISLEKPEDN
ncbi:ribosome biogenesis GTPase YlqF [Herbivorax sp. ANBcel31]|uniref:ribosome biogenesis GTPase YlqF n=1 Tax=Herbivorax sp. ANBcel31 TaxID=3069754 RepID=UPI0027B08AEC|nr:ribosome biogenesis GTPase YlqF [Herbivorax sp. ANBcel31]MDQ2087206.1 ribosome biogenesis GTPase YlqF [Herbivorax sp. ANBcel31]